MSRSWLKFQNIFILSGVSQAGVISPILFDFYTNYVALEVDDSNNNIFAGDTDLNKIFK